MGERRAALRVLTLDVLGTLLELDQPARRLREALRGEPGVAISPLEAQRALAAEFAYYRAHHLEGSDRRSLAELRRRCALALAAALPQAQGGAPAIETVQAALMAALRFRPFGEVQAALRRARAHGLKLIAVSNWDVSLPCTLERAGLAKLLDGVVCSAGVGAAKPARAPFERALALAGAEPQEALHVGDSIEADVAGAQAVGMRAALLVRAHGAPQQQLQGAVPVIASLDQLPDLTEDATADGEGR
ncbi:MAG TPA: HAD family hydrolase [Solirubrobacteraceae bacterium]|nr:HAD family hydrolase [Solirubrobacteraceae bacterium]